MHRNQQGTRRWTHFHSALQLAVQRSAHKWTVEDFAECFPLYVEEDRDGSSTTFNTISDFIETKNLRDLEQLLKDYNVQENVDTLHRIVNEAKDRKAKGDAGRDVWQDNLDPKQAVAARTVPVLTSEAAKLKELLADLEGENRVLEAELKDKVKSREQLDEQLLDVLDKVDLACENWEKLPQDEIEPWSMVAAESLPPTM